MKKDSIGLYRGTKWVAESQQLVFAGNQPGHGIQLYLQSIEGGKPQAITPEGIDARESSFAVSPDGKSGAAKYAPDQKIYIYSVEGGEPQPVNGIIPCDNEVE